MADRVYIYQAALLCEECGDKRRADLNDAFLESGADLGSDQDDSDRYPQPCADGGGEADTPQHCDACGTFLENPLTSDGYAYVYQAITENIATGRGSRDVLDQWIERYDVTLSDVMDYRGGDHGRTPAEVHIA